MSLSENRKRRGSHCFFATCAEYRDSISKQKGITFHSFPNKDTEGERHSQWIQECGREQQPSPWALVCSNHFHEDCFDRSGQQVRLKDGSVPSKSEPKKIRLEDMSKILSPQAINLKNVPSKYQNEEHTYAGSPSMWKKKLDKTEKRLEICQRKLSNLLRRERRAKKNLSNVLSDLKKKNLVNEELRLKLHHYADIPIELFQRSAVEYTLQQREFALTLNLMSPKAYDYLRLKRKISLPHPRSLRRWMESVDARPGINTPMLQVLCEKKEQNPEEYTRCVLMIDAMAIRQHVEYDSVKGTFSGYVDLGNGQDSDIQAKEALVFMLVGICGSWKAPIAYFFTAGLNAESQKELVEHVISQLQELGFRVCALTMDGHGTNVAMGYLLGANLEIGSKKTKPYFEIEGGGKICVMFDACHMVKLASDMLQAYGTIVGPLGQISWKYISMLHEVQSTEGLRLGNRLSASHVNFLQQKMKVSLAVQTFSSSVAKALRVLCEMGHPDFSGSGATADFIERIDRLFDLFNSRSPFGKGFKRPVKEQNVANVRAFLYETRSYLLELKMIDGRPLYTSRREMCLRGFVLLIDSADILISELLQHQKYVLFYKFSQDHLELFFNAIRRSGGWNNNPTTKTFTAAFRKIITHCGALKVSQSGNCSELDSTMLIQSGISTYLPPVKEDQLQCSTTDFEDDCFNNFEHCYVSKQLSLLVENAVVYIAGWVVRKLLPKLSCLKCREALVSDLASISEMYTSSYHLLKLKQNGGLVVPSTGCVQVLLSAERCIRQSLEKISKVSKTLKLLIIQSKVIAQVGGGDILSDAQHALDTQVGIENHHLCLIRQLVSTYFSLRQHHIVKLHNAETKGKSVRHSLSKTILFKGQ